MTGSISSTSCHGNLDENEAVTSIASVSTWHQNYFDDDVSDTSTVSHTSCHGDSNENDIARKWNRGKLQQCWRENGYMSCCAVKGEAYLPQDIEQKANIITHGMHIIPALFAVYDMYGRSERFAEYLCTAVYGTSLVMLFTVSTVFHVISLMPKWRMSKLRKILHLGDRLMIYLFISSSYMPWLLLQPITHGKNILAAVWSMAAAGTVYSLLLHEKYKTIETVIYLCQGFIPAYFLVRDTTTSMLELALGGMIYVVGVIFFKADGKIPFAHAIWHFFGSSAAWVHHYGIWIHFYYKTK